MIGRFDQLVEETVRFRNERDWKQFHTPKDLAISIVLEASELLAHFQWVKDETSAQKADSHKQEIAAELADVLIYLILLANDLSVSLVDVACRKLMENAQKYPVEKTRGSAKKYTEL